MACSHTSSSVRVLKFISLLFQQADTFNMLTLEPELMQIVAVLLEVTSITALDEKQLLHQKSNFNPKLSP